METNGLVEAVSKKNSLASIINQNDTPISTEPIDAKETINTNADTTLNTDTNTDLNANPNITSANSNSNDNSNSNSNNNSNTNADTVINTNASNSSEKLLIPTSNSINTREENGSVQRSSAKKKDVPPRKRTKVSRACDQCRRKKIRCDGLFDQSSNSATKSCSTCLKANENCTYVRTPLKRGPSKGYSRDSEDLLSKNINNNHNHNHNHSFNLNHSFNPSHPSNSNFQFHQEQILSQRQPPQPLLLSQQLQQQPQNSLPSQPSFQPIQHQNNPLQPSTQKQLPASSTLPLSNKNPILLPPISTLTSQTSFTRNPTNFPSAFQSQIHSHHYPDQFSDQFSPSNYLDSALSRPRSQSGSIINNNSTDPRIPNISNPDFQNSSSGNFWKVPYNLPFEKRNMSSDSFNSYNTPNNNDHNKQFNNLNPGFTNFRSTNFRSTFSGGFNDSTMNSDSEDSDFISRSRQRKTPSINNSPRNSFSQESTVARNIGITASPAGSISSLSSLNQGTRNLEIRNSPTKYFPQLPIFSNSSDVSFNIQQSPSIQSQNQNQNQNPYDPSKSHNSHFLAQPQPIPKYNDINPNTNTNANANELKNNLDLYYATVHKSIPILPINRNAFDYILSHAQTLESKEVIINLFDTVLQFLISYLSNDDQNLIANTFTPSSALMRSSFTNKPLMIKEIIHPLFTKVFQIHNMINPVDINHLSSEEQKDNAIVTVFLLFTINLINFIIIKAGEEYSSSFSLSFTILNSSRIHRNIKSLIKTKKSLEKNFSKLDTINFNQIMEAIDVDNVDHIKLLLMRLYVDSVVLENIYSLSFGFQRMFGGMKIDSDIVKLLLPVNQNDLNSSTSHLEVGLILCEINDKINCNEEFQSLKNYTCEQTENVENNIAFLFFTMIKVKLELVEVLKQCSNIEIDSRKNGKEDLEELVQEYQSKLHRICKRLISTISSLLKIFSDRERSLLENSKINKRGIDPIQSPFLPLIFKQSIKLKNVIQIITNSMDFNKELLSRSSKIFNDIIAINDSLPLIKPFSESPNYTVTNSKINNYLFEIKSSDLNELLEYNKSAGEKDITKVVALWKNVVLDIRKFLKKDDAKGWLY
ncbi:uncharacterized protein ASCRUDRAFT_78590 [Ascoidea rubescens DSM 1968]|uniref:Zn(2)-C6 fungal-type domain-containing protein n=1 Tax=Ascoidea rubescens DSM 1968 TaxID=1344418 RepID=A0A1D2VPG2_9ASCO|nr:hypothetical protein ASCRUDRAFT_78590 [Ascoidea rubescens DSM 1968]ODV63501.1 hypothetical protein ASCRUDRAFT_78590 [Ascoidea rubescens DSM 1968]